MSAANSCSKCFSGASCRAASLTAGSRHQILIRSQSASLRLGRHPLKQPVRGSRGRFAGFRVFLDRRDRDDGGQSLPAPSSRQAGSAWREACPVAACQDGQAARGDPSGQHARRRAAATMTAVITKRLFGEGEGALALGTVAISFALLVFSEITPKVVGAAHADRLAPVVSYVLAPMLEIASPVVWFVNLFVQGLLRVLAIRPVDEANAPLTQEELRSLVLEGQSLRGKHRAMLANLFDLDSVRVDDVMTPRNQIEAIDLADKPGLLAEKLASSYHTR